MSGSFITIEGIDGAGKTSAIEALQEEFDVSTTAEPSEFWTGKQVRRALQDDTPSFTDFFLFMADRQYHIEEFIQPSVEDGEVVISDRFSDSTLAYQPVQLEDDVRFPQMWMENVMEPWNIDPDLTIYIEISVDTALERADQEKKYETREMLERVKTNYDQLKKRFSERFHVVDGERSQEEVQEEIIDIVGQHIEYTR